MFRLLSKESNIFSVPVYIFFLLFIVIAFNVLNFNYLDGISAVITFCGVALCYFIFNQINLTYQTHLPLFLYTFFVYALYPGNLDIGIAVSLLTNSFLLLILTSTDDDVRKKSYVLVGTILAINYLFLPTTWPMLIFVILHVIATSERIGLNLFRLFFGIILAFSAYFCVMYFFHYTTFNPEYIPIPSSKPFTNYSNLIYLLPVLAMMVYAVFDHFRHYNKKSPTSRFKYTFLLVFMSAQLVTIILYMGNHYEYLLLMAFPASIILTRVLKFFPNYLMKEIGLWLVIICLILFKLSTFFHVF